MANGMGKLRSTGSFERLEPLLKALQKAQRNILGEIDYINNVRTDITGNKMPIYDLRYWLHDCCAKADLCLEGEPEPNLFEGVEKTEITANGKTVTVEGDFSEACIRASQKIISDVEKGKAI